LEGFAEFRAFRRINRKYNFRKNFPRKPLKQKSYNTSLAWRLFVRYNAQQRSAGIAIETHSKPMKTLCRTRGLYHDLIVTRKGVATTLWSAKGVRHTVFDRSAPHLPGLEYARNMLVALAFCPGAQSCLVLGLGGGSIPRMLLAARPQMIMDIVEIDPAVVELAERYFDFSARPKLRIHVEDAARFLRSCPSRYEIIIVDAYLGHQYPNQCATEEFFKDARDRLADDGVIALNWLSDDVQATRGILTKLESIVGPVWQLSGLKADNILYFSSGRISSHSTLFSAAETAAMDASFLQPLRRLASRLREPASSGVPPNAN
jgi:spermidine synthase